MVAKKILLKASVASLTQYEAKSGEKLPVIVTVIDGYEMRD